MDTRWYVVYVFVRCILSYVLVRASDQFVSVMCVLLMDGFGSTLHRFRLHVTSIVAVAGYQGKNNNKNKNRNKSEN